MRSQSFKDYITRSTVTQLYDKEKRLSAVIGRVIEMEI